MSEDWVDQTLRFPNRISRIVLLAVEDVLGANSGRAVLTMARLSHLIDAYPTPDFGPGLAFTEIGRLFDAVEGLHGVKVGRQLMRQAGRESFGYWIEGFGGVVGFADVALRLLPLSLRVRIGMEVLAEIFNRYSDQRVILDEEHDTFFFILERCGFCTGRQAETPACAFVLGVLEATLFWISRGRRYAVEETACIASGSPACKLCVSRIPLERRALDMKYA